MSTRAVIDVGTNSVKLLVGRVEPAGVERLLETARQTRLGVGLYEGRRLQPAAVERTAAAVAELAQIARDAGAARIRVIATSAAREAANAGELSAAVLASSGCPLEVIPGDLEAEWAYQGVASDPALASRALLIVDAGGGSTECVVGQGAGVQFRRSFPIGTVRLHEHLAVADPPAAEDWQRCVGWLDCALREQVLPDLAPVLRDSPAVEVIASSGTATILARLELGLESYDPAQLDGVRLELARLTAWRQRLWSLDLAARRRVKGLPPDRADVMLAGVAIHEALLRALGLPRLRVSLRGLRYAALQAA